MIEEKLSILKLMSEMTARTDMNDFAKKIGLTPTQIMAQMQELAKEGYLKKIGSGFALTDKGKLALKTSTRVPENQKFQFYVTLGHPTDQYASTVKEFRDQALKVDVAALEFHLYRGDFENWFKSSVAEPQFADELAKIRKTNLRGEELRKALLKAVDIRFNL